MCDQDRISPLQHPYNIKQTSDENKEQCRLEGYQMIQYQILWTILIRIVWQKVRRITHKILGVKGLIKVHLNILNPLFN